jgi:uncharacterized protein YhfF
MNKSVQMYWRQFQDSLPEGSPYRSEIFTAEGWGDGVEMADELGALIAAGTKTATCSAVWEWQAEGKAWPMPGAFTVVLNGHQQPLCIIETTQVTILNFDEVDADFAFEEGEGDRSLAYWREVHRKFFTNSLSKIGRQFSEDMPLVCERFRLITV